MRNRKKVNMNISAKIPTYAALINSKIAIPSGSTPYFAVEQHFFFDRMADYLRSVFVDSDWYLAAYPDVGEAISAGKVLGAEEHYRRYGYFEHRKPYEIKVDEAWYAESYPDVQLAITSNVFESAQEHFDKLGFKEGRLPYANFALRSI
jgi:hypothetical protein